MEIPRSIKELCTPAFAYFIFGAIGLVHMIIKNIYIPSNEYRVGPIALPVMHKFPLFVIKAVVLVAWTFLLNFLCSRGYSTLSWVIFLWPIVLFLFTAVGISLFVYDKNADPSNNNETISN